MTRFVIGNVGVFPFSGSAAVTGNLQVSGAGNHPGAILEVMGPATGPGLRVTGNAEITGDLTVKGTTIIVDSATNLKIEGELSSSGPLIVTGQGQVKGALLVSGASTFNNDVTVTKDLHVTSGLTISGSTTANSSSMTQLNVSRGLTTAEGAVVRGTLKVSGAATFAGTAGLAATTVTSLDVSDGNITNVGDIDADSVSVADAANGLNIDFSGANTGTGIITVADNLAAALTVKEGSNEIVKVVSTNSSEEIVLGYKLDLGDNDIENVGTISADVLQPDAAGVGLDIQFEGNTTKNKMSLTDNLADALNITQGGNSYLKFTTTNDTEAITAGKNVVLGGELSGSGLANFTSGIVNKGTLKQSGSVTLAGLLSSSAPIQTSNEMRVGAGLVVSGAIQAASLAVASADINNGNIANVGDIDVDSVSIADAAVGLNIDFSGANTGLGVITVADNLAAALTVKEGSNEIVKIVSTNSSEQIILGYDLGLIGDGAAVNFGANAEVVLSHVHNEGLLLTHTATGDNTPVTLTLKSEENAIVADEVIGAIKFKGGDSDGTDTILIAAAIEAVAEDTHEADRNATKLAFKTAISEDATEKMTLTSSGSLGIGVTDPDAKLEVFSTATQAKFSYDTDSFATITVADGGATTIATSETGNLILNSDDIVLVADGGQVLFQNPLETNRFAIDVEATTTFLSNVQNTDLVFRVGSSPTEVFRLDQSEDSILVATDSKIQFRDTATFVSSTGANVLNITAPTLDIDASTAVTIDTDTITVASANSTDPLVVIKNTTNDANGARLQFVKDKGAAGADGDDIGIIEFVGDDAAQTQTTFAKIVAEVSESADTDEAGKLSFFVAESDGTTTALAAGLVLEGEHATDGEVDVTIAAGAASTTTVAGTLTVTSGIDGNNAAITNVGDIDADSVSIADAAVGLNIDFSGANTGLGLITIADNLAAALTVKEGSNEIVKIVSTNSSEEIVLGYKLDLGDNDIENVGTISADVLQPDAAAIGLDIQFEGNTTKNKMTLTDNLADALNITEGSNSYLKFTTTDDSEAITAGVAVNGTIFSGSTSILSQKDLKAHDANIEAMIKVSGNIRCGLTSSTAVTVNVNTLDSYKAPQFYLLSGTTTVKLPGNHPAGTWFVFKAANAHFGPLEDTITLSGTSGDTIDGNTNHVIQAPFASVNCVSDGANWFIW